MDVVLTEPVFIQVLGVHLVGGFDSRQKSQDFGYRTPGNHLFPGERGHQVNLAEPELVGNVTAH